MICVSVLYPNAKDTTFDHEYYWEKHIATVREKMTPLGLVRVEVNRGLADAAGGPAPMLAMAHMYFASMEVLQTAMASPAAGEMEADLANFTNAEPIVQISQVVE